MSRLPTLLLSGPAPPDAAAVWFGGLPMDAPVECCYGPPNHPRAMGLWFPKLAADAKLHASVLTIYTPPDGGSLHTSDHEMNLRANMAQKRSVLNATPANEIGMAGGLRIGDWRSPERQPPKRAPALAPGESTV